MARQTHGSKTKWLSSSVGLPCHPWASFHESFSVQIPNGQAAALVIDRCQPAPLAVTRLIDSGSCVRPHQSGYNEQRCAVGLGSVP